MNTLEKLVLGGSVVVGGVALYLALQKPKAVPLEGDYSTWSIYDSFDDIDANNSPWYQEALVNGDETIILLMDSTSVIIKTYTIATKTLSEPIITGVWWGPSDLAYGASERSILETYIVVMWATSGPYYSCDRLSIIKNGVVVKTFTNIELGFGSNNIRSVSISRSGKYVVASGIRDTSGNNGWVILVGS